MDLREVLFFFSVKVYIGVEDVFGDNIVGFGNDEEVYVIDKVYFLLC